MADPSARWHGLDSAEARRRLARAGPNELPQPPRRGFLRLALGVLAEPMFLLLALAAAIYLLVGDLAEGLMLSGFAVLTIGLVVIQQARSDRAIEALRALGAPLARVMRDGTEQRIPARQVVVGDLLLVGEGERVAADALLRRCDELSIDESLLTGESVSVSKVHAAGAPPDPVPGGDGLPWVFAGTLVVRGHGIAEVMETGLATQAGRIGVSLASIELEPTLLQRTVGRLVRLFGFDFVFAAARNRLDRNERGGGRRNDPANRVSCRHLGWGEQEPVDGGALDQRSRRHDAGHQPHGQSRPRLRTSMQHSKWYAPPQDSVPGIGNPSRVSRPGRRDGRTVPVS